jgi:protein phosphatase
MRCSDGSPTERPSLQAVALELGRIRSQPSIDWAAETAKGRVRDVQEDSWLAVEMGGASAAGGFDLFVVADGMGGMSAGEVASALAVRTFAYKLAGELSGQETSSGSDDLVDAGRVAFRAAADAVQSYASAHPAASDLGTTLTAVCISGSAALIVHAGDTRCDLIRNGEIRQLTADHTVTARLVEIGELNADEAALHPQRSTLYRSLSAGRRAEPDVSIEELEGDDWLVLTTDGVHGLVGPEHMLASVVESPTRAAHALVADSLLAGGHDNATALVVRVRPSPGRR